MPLGSREVKETLKRIGHFPTKGSKLITPEGATIVNTVDELFHVFETVHFLLVGEPSGWIPRVLTAEEFRARVWEYRDVELFDAVAWCCEYTDAGVELVLNGERRAYQVLAFIGHEAGHARQQALNDTQYAPEGTPDGRNTNFGALHEAQAFAFEAAVVRKVGELTGINATCLSTRYLLTEWVEGWIAWQRENLDDLTRQHSRGLSLLWGAVLGDPNLDLKQELLDEGILSADSMLRLHDYLVMIERDEVEAYVEKYVGTIDEEAKLIKDTILRRDASLPDDGFFEHVSTIFLLP